MPIVDSDVKEKAFRVIPGIEYNQTLEELADGATVFYEMVLPENMAWNEFCTHTAPRFHEYLTYKRAPLQSVMVVLFVGAECYLFQGDVFQALLDEGIPGGQTLQLAAA